MYKTNVKLYLVNRSLVWREGRVLGGGSLWLPLENAWKLGEKLYTLAFTVKSIALISNLWWDLNYSRFLTFPYWFFQSLLMFWTWTNRPLRIYNKKMHSKLCNKNRLFRSKNWTDRKKSHIFYKNRLYFTKISYILQKVAYIFTKIAYILQKSLIFFIKIAYLAAKSLMTFKQAIFLM